MIFHNAKLNIKNEKEELSIIRVKISTIRVIRILLAECNFGQKIFLHNKYVEFYM